jgi:UDP-N-acetylglucosamine--N-acetylmuramyl-(pentapeptide) pyrophosphoryl-undecaprenol N-acetylglucosamine transferase
MDLAYAAADLVISRAGALSIAELQLCGKATILVPSPNVSEDHQTKNAMALVNKQAAVLIKDTEAKEKLVKEAIALMHNQSLLITLKIQIKGMAMEKAAEKIAQELLKLKK